MTNTALLKKLREDVAAASTPDHAHPGDDVMEGMTNRLFCDECNERERARARLAALPGPELVEAVLFWHENMLIEEHSDLCAYEQSSGADDCDCGGAVLDRCATALEVT